MMNTIIKRDLPFYLCDINILLASDNQLEQISTTMHLGLSLTEMKAIRDYFKSKGRNPTDIELQSFGQAWSEHCCYKSSKSTLKEFIFKIERDDVLSKGDAGVMIFDDEYGYALRIESHNHPSAIEPYGGAMTGVGGIIRDIVCMGAQPVGLADILCFGPIHSSNELSDSTKHSIYLINGVISGIRDYGNRVGLPTITGGLFFDEGYNSNCLVNVGCIGIVKLENILRNYAGGPGEIMILVGGYTGRDGIHGVNFASSDLAFKSSESIGAVQLGDPITEEPTIHACLEVSSKHLITGMKDLGGGGLSCVIGEMALGGGCGADVYLEKVPLKDSTLAPWEIWVSESQERMMCTCKPENVEYILDIFKMWDVPATPIAKTTDRKCVRIFWNNELISDIDLEFLTGGPVYNRPYITPMISTKESEIFPDIPNNYDVILTLLSDSNIASKECIIRQYDHEVRASTVIHPMVGSIGKTGPGDASVILPVTGSRKGLAIALGCNPWFTNLDPYNGGKSCVDEAYRNLVAVGARPNAFTDSLNFGNPENPKRMGEFREAVRGIGEVAAAMNIPIPSGNVSFYNEAHDGHHIHPTPMILGCGIICDIRKAITADFKSVGSRIFIIGNTKDEMGASLLFRKFNGTGGVVPRVDVETLKVSSDRLLTAMSMGLVLSCHDCSDGGLIVAIAEMCISGNIGANIDLSTIHGMSIERKMYSESNSRWIVEVDDINTTKFMDILGNYATLIGTTDGNSLSIMDTKTVVSLDDMRKAWNYPIQNIMGASRDET